MVQPGGSVKDAEVIAAADERGLAMVFTGRRHFRHRRNGVCLASAFHSLRRLVALVARSAYFVALGNSAIWDANEAFYVETPREMLERATTSTRRSTTSRASTSRS